MKKWGGSHELDLPQIHEFFSLIENSCEMIFLKEESFKIIRLCMEVHNQLGAGFLEIVYKDALEYEFKKEIFLMRGRKI